MLPTAGCIGMRWKQTACWENSFLFGSQKGAVRTQRPCGGHDSHEYPWEAGEREYQPVPLRGVQLFTVDTLSHIKCTSTPGSVCTPPDCGPQGHVGAGHSHSCLKLERGILKECSHAGPAPWHVRAGTSGDRLPGAAHLCQRFPVKRGCALKSSVLLLPTWG